MHLLCVSSRMHGLCISKALHGVFLGTVHVQWQSIYPFDSESSRPNWHRQCGRVTIPSTLRCGGLRREIVRWLVFLLVWLGWVVGSSISNWGLLRRIEKGMDRVLFKDAFVYIYCTCSIGIFLSCFAFLSGSFRRCTLP